jgi:hypothetical protein
MPDVPLKDPAKPKTVRDYLGEIRDARRTIMQVLAAGYERDMACYADKAESKEDLEEQRIRLELSRIDLAMAEIAILQATG